MRRTLAFILVLATGAVALDSPFFCIDGCDRSDTAHHQTTRVPCGSCITCQSGSLPELGSAALPPLAVAAIAPRNQPPPLTGQSTTIDHPPRTA